MNSYMKFLPGRTEIMSAEGYAVYVLINAKSGKPEIIPEDIKDKYSI
jgi:acyl-CoA thioesterase FadM